MENINLGISEKSKTGIMTFYEAHNYGAVLQAYALLSFFKNKGINVEIVTYVSDKMIKNYDIKPRQYRSLKDNLSLIKNYSRNKAQGKAFERFRREKLGVKSDKIVTKKQIGQDYTSVIIGSDQIWNMDIVGDDYAYWADFKKSGQKVYSYAGSFGVSSIDDEYRKEIERKADNFNGITVREKAAQRILKESGIESEQVCDPVFLLSVEKWAEFSKEVMVNKPFIFVYMLQPNKELSKEIESLRDEKKYEVIIVHPTNVDMGIEGDMIKNVSPEQFVWLIKNAEVVATNSFHAVSFSIIFDKKLIYKPHNKLGSRTEELLEMVKYDGRTFDYGVLNELIDKSKRIIDSWEL